MKEQFQYKRREELRVATIQAFAHHQEVFQVFFFGKEVAGNVDRFSDIDMVVCSRNLATTQQTYRQTFESISPIRSTLLLESTAKQFAEMLMLKEYSPYQKIDFSIVSDIRDKQQFGPFRLMYECERDADHSLTTFDGCDLIALHRNVVYVLQDILFSVARFTKCLFRQDGEMYRRWKSLTNMAIVLLYEKYFGWQAETVKKQLTAYETKHLSEALSSQDHGCVEAIYPSNGLLHLAQSYHASINLVIELSRQKAAYFGVSLDTEFIIYIQEFLQAELSQYDRHQTGGSYSSSLQKTEE